MGLEKAKSLLDLKEGRNFLDFIALQAAECTRLHEIARDRTRSHEIALPLQASAHLGHTSATPRLDLGHTSLDLGHTSARSPPDLGSTSARPRLDLRQTSASPSLVLQVEQMRSATGVPLAFMLMNSSAAARCGHVHVLLPDPRGAMNAQTP